MKVDETVRGADEIGDWAKRDFQDEETQPPATMDSTEVSGSRLQQVVEWLGGDDARGLICLDEAHKGETLGGQCWQAILLPDRTLCGRLTDTVP